jgi:transposase
LQQAAHELRSVTTSGAPSGSFKDEQALLGKVTLPVRLSQQRRDKRLQRYEQVVALHQQMVPLRAIARQLGMHRSTVRQWIRAGCFPERIRPNRSSRVDSWLGYLNDRWREGCTNAAKLTEELRTQGFGGSYNMVRRHVASWRSHDAVTSVQSRTKAFVRLTPKSMAWLLFKSPQERDAEQQRLLEIFCESCPAAQEAADLAASFRDLVRQRRVVGLDAWLTRAAAASAPAELQRFAAGLKDDLAAVRAALSLAWSNGQTEGQVNRLKLIKRQMYGRANLDLLRQRVLAMTS